MSFKDVGAVEALLRCRSTAGTKAADHSTFVVSEGVPVLIVLPCETFDVVLACGDWALLWPFVLVRKHMSLQVFEHTSALWQWAHALLHCLIVQVKAAPTAAAPACV